MLQVLFSKFIFQILRFIIRNSVVIVREDVDFTSVVAH